MDNIVQPTLVIGLGGTGKSILLALKKMIAENSPGGMTDYPFLRVLAIDTDEGLPSNNSSIQTLSQRELSLDGDKEIFALRSDFNVVPDLSHFPQVDEWFPGSLKHYLTPAQLAKGAGQKKPIGRFTLAWNAQEIYSRLHNLLANPVDIQTAKGRAIGDNLSGFTNVFICGSLAGGTGAGTFLDVAYLVRYIASTLANRQIFVYGLLGLSTLFDGIQGDAQIKPNCYASLVELDHFTNEFTFGNPYRKFHPAYKNYNPDYSKAGENVPFDFPFLFDKTNQGGLSFNSPAAFGEMAARFIYLLTGHEVSRDWQSMDNNVRKNLETTYDRSILEKPIQYRSMGAFSVLFPKRMVIQLCAYRMTGEYLRKILEDDYAPQEILNVTDRFLGDLKFNPSNEQLEVRFDQFRDADSNGRFTDYLETQKRAFLDGDHEKKELLKELAVWKDDMDKKVVEFRQLNATTARDVRAEFLARLQDQLAQWVDLKLRPDDSNRTVNGEPRVVRGSLRRQFKILEALGVRFTEAVTRYRKAEEEAIALEKNSKSDIDSALDDLETSLRSLLPNNTKIKGLTDEVLIRMTDHLNAQRRRLISGWILQLMTGVLENNIPKYDGLIVELERLTKVRRKGVLDFEELAKKVGDFLARNRRYEPNMLSDVIFDYEQDVEGTYGRLLAKLGEDVVFESLSDTLKGSSDFGPAYERLKELDGQPQLMLNLVLREAERSFYSLVDEVSIEDKILNSPDHLNRLVNGNYMKNAAIFLGLDGGELARVNINLESSTFFAITIPDDYTGKPCASLRGALNASAGRKICPMEANPEKFRDEPCPKFEKCLKQVILRNAPQNIAVIPTSERSEVNIVTTIAGYPLHAVTSVIHNCRPQYMQLKAKLEGEAKSKELSEEKLHMFGPIRFDDLLDKSEDPRSGMKDFRKLLLVALCANRLRIQPLEVSFVTKRDIDTNRKDQPSLILGRNIDHIFQRFQSTRVEDQKAINDFQTETEFLLKTIRDKEEPRNKFVEMVKATYAEISQKLPAGLAVADLDLLNEFAEQVLNFRLIPVDTTGDNIFG